MIEPYEVRYCPLVVNVNNKGQNYIFVYSYSKNYKINIMTGLSTSYLAPGGGCEVLFLPGLSVCVSVCLSVCLSVCVSGRYFGILFLGY